MYNQLINGIYVVFAYIIIFSLTNVYFLESHNGIWWRMVYEQEIDWSLFKRYQKVCKYHFFKYKKLPQCSESSLIFMSHLRKRPFGWVTKGEVTNFTNKEIIFIKSGLANAYSFKCLFECLFLTHPSAIVVPIAGYDSHQTATGATWDRWWEGPSCYWNYNKRHFSRGLHLNLYLFFLYTFFCIS